VARLTLSLSLTGSIEQQEADTFLSNHTTTDEDEDLESAFLAEAFGTCLYVQIGCAANCVAKYTQDAVAFYWPVAVVWAVALTLGIYIASPLSGGHLNPAVTLSFGLVRPANFELGRKLFLYVAAQLLGGIVAGGLNFFSFTRPFPVMKMNIPLSGGCQILTGVLLALETISGKYVVVQYVRLVFSGSTICACSYPLLRSLVSIRQMFAMVLMPFSWKPLERVSSSL
jgi:glycerol uptake facilitator-like aquaporin